MLGQLFNSIVQSTSPALAEAAFATAVLWQANPVFQAFSL